MEIQNVWFLNPQTITSVAFKLFAIILSLFYLLYAIVVAKQSQVMNKTLEVKNNHIFSLISSTQITTGLILIILSIVLV